MKNKYEYQLAKKTHWKIIYEKIPDRLYLVGLCLVIDTFTGNLQQNQEPGTWNIQKIRIGFILYISQYVLYEYSKSLTQVDSKLRFLHKIRKRGIQRFLYFCFRIVGPPTTKARISRTIPIQ